jgi:predicted transcriptional regulator
MAGGVIYIDPAPNQETVEQLRVNKPAILSFLEIEQAIIEACKAEYLHRKAGRIAKADEINQLLDAIDSPELKPSDPAFIRSYLDLVRALKQ